MEVQPVTRSASGSRVPTRRPRARRQRLTQLAVGLGALLCIVLVAAGVAAVLVRPLAPQVGDVPPASTWFEPAVLSRIAAYRRPLYVVVPLTVLLAALGPLVIVTRPAVRRVLRSSRAPVPGCMRQAAFQAAGVAVGVVLLQDLLLLPARWWIGYVHAGAYGLRTQGMAGWTADLAIANATGWVGVAIVVAVSVGCLWLLPRFWPFVLALSMPVLTIITLVVWPLVIEPLRFDFTALPDGSTRTAVEEVRQAAGMDDAPIVVADASRRTTRRNAYISGVGATRRIVLYDTLLDLPDEQVAAVVAHEAAHGLHDDLLRGWLTGAAAVVVTTMLAAVIVGRDPGRLRRNITDGGWVATVVALALLVEVLMTPATSWVSRRAEAAADATALELTADPQAFVELQRSLVETNLSDPTPPTWWVWWRATHPVPAARIHRADVADLADVAGVAELAGVAGATDAPLR